MPYPRRLRLALPAVVASVLTLCLLVAMSAPTLAAAVSPKPIVAGATPPVLPEPLTAPATPIVGGSSAGYLPESWDVTPDGAFTDSIPLEVPAGRAGMAPHLMLGYSSSGGNGLVGIGWSLSGAFSRISRCGKSLSTEGTLTGITYDQSDRYCLDGQKLIAVGGIDYGSGDYGDIDTQYRTETDKFAQIISTGSGATIASGPDKFLVRTKSGHVMTYEPQNGTRTMSGVGFNPSPVEVKDAITFPRSVWLLTSEADRSGNEIRYTYTGDFANGDYRPDRITYTYNTGLLQGQRYVEFTYEDRPDVDVAYERGVKYSLGKRIKSIGMFAPNPGTTTLVWRYKLNYITSASSKRSLLTSVARCGPSGGCMKAKQFDWDNPGGMPWFTSKTAGQAIVNTAGIRPPAMHVMDIDGDGTDDAVYSRGGTSDADDPINARLGFRLNTGTVSPLSDLHLLTGNGLPANTSLIGSRPLDFDADGRTELDAKWSQAQTWQDTLVEWDEATKKFVDAGVTFSSGPNTDFGDMNGDGFADALNNSTLQLNMWGSVGLSHPLTGATGCSRRIVDSDGDGRAELVNAELSGKLCTNKTFVLRADDAGNVTKTAMTFTASGVTYFRVLPQSLSAYVTRLGDFNGDGLTDTLLVPNDTSKPATILWNTGAGLRLDSHAITIPRDQYADLRIADVNGDGRDDVVALHAKTTLLLSMGDGTFTQGDIAADSGTVVPKLGRTTTQLGDFDGDGRVDVVRIVNNTMTLLLQSSNASVDRLIAVHDEGTPWKRETVTYSTAWTDHPENIGEYTCAYPLICQRHGMVVVRQVDSAAHAVDVPAANITKRTLQYSYEDPVANLRGRGFLGFGTFRVWDPQRPSETITTFNHRTQVDGKYYPNVDRPLAVTTVVPILTAAQAAAKPGTATARVTRTVFTNETRKLNNGKTYALLPKGSVQKEWEEPITIIWGQLGGNLGSPKPQHLVDVVEPLVGEHQITSSFTVDDYGNTTYASQFAAKGTLQVVETQYDNRIDDWLISLPTVQTDHRAEFGNSPPAVTRHLERHYDGLGRLDTVFVEKGNADPSIPQTTEYAYDAYGVMRKVKVTAAGQPDRVTHIEYAPFFAGQPDEEVYPSQTWADHNVAALRPSQWTVYQPGYGVVVASEDANGVVDTAQYDEFGRPVKITPAGGAEVVDSYSPRPDKAGGTNGTIVTTTSDGRTSQTITDGLGRTIAATYTGFDGQVSSTATGFDLLGRLASQTRPYQGNVPSGSVGYDYDSLDRQVKTTLPDGGAETATYSGNTTKSFDAAGNETDTTVDADGRVITRTEINIKPAVSITPITTSYEYAPFDLLSKVQDDQGNVTSFDYDVLGRRTQVHEPDRGVTTDTYFATGEVHTETHIGTGNSSTYAYDDLGRKVSTVNEDGATTFAWDSSANGIGQLAYAISPDAIRTNFRYDNVGRAASVDYVDQTDNNTTYTIDRHYTSTGRLDSMSYPDASGSARFSLGYVFNNHGFLETINRVTPGQNPIPVWKVTARYADLSLDTGVLGSNGQIGLKHAVDPKTGRITGIAAAAGGQSLLNLGYTYNSAGLVASRTEQDTSADRSEVYKYDSVGRLFRWDLTNGNGPTTSTGYDYDSIGNLKMITRNGGMVDERTFGDPNGTQPHALTSRDATTGGGPLEAYHYDKQGRLTQTEAEDSSITRETSYTSADLPKTLTKGGQTWTFAYDAFGQRVKKSGPDGTTFSVPGMYERRTVGNKVAFVYYVQGTDGPVAQVVSDGLGTTTEYQVTDQLGSIGAVVSESGAVRHSLFYDPFGARINADGTAVTGDTGTTRKGFTGQEHDDDVGLINMKGRVYDPVLQRFLTGDPVVGNALSSQSWNSYSYVLNSPLNYTDPTGYIYSDSTCSNASYLPECSGGGSGSWGAYSGGGPGGGGSGYNGGAFNPSYGDKDGGWWARDFQRDMASFFGAAEAYGNGGAHGLAAYERGDLGREVSALQAEWGPGGFMAKAAALKAPKSDGEGYKAAKVSPTSPLTCADPDCDSEGAKKAAEAAQGAQGVKSNCGDWQSTSGTGMYVQQCSYRNVDTSWSELHWYNAGTETAYLGTITILDAYDFSVQESNCSGGAVGAGQSGSCVTGYGERNDGYQSDVEYWSPREERWVTERVVTWSDHHLVHGGAHSWW
jgi:RHS repeat-associated protein